MSALDEAEAEVSKAERNLEVAYRNIENDCGTIVENVKEEGHQLIKDAEKELIREVVAKIHVNSIASKRKHNDSQIKALIDLSQSDWNSYREKLDGTAKGEWTDKAEDDIASQSRKLGNILPGVSDGDFGLPVGH